MIGIVVVSHSRALGAAAAALAGEMVQDGSGPVIEVAAGLDETTTGTDATAVAEAIGRADAASAGDGVLVLVDLGSAVLSAEMALELVDAEVAGRTRLSSAPLVEGLVAAAVTAAAGVDVMGVAAEAARGLDAKRDHVGDLEPQDGAAFPADGAADATSRSAADLPGDEPQVAADTVADDAELRLQVSVDTPHGLHARPAARLVALVNRHPSARVRVSNVETGQRPVDARSLSAVARLGVLEGHRVEFRVGGPDAQQVVDDLEQLAAAGFGDRADAAVAGRPRPTPRRSPWAVGSGLGAAIGPALRRTVAPDLTAYQDSGEPARERERLDRALETAGSDLMALADGAEGTDAAEMMRAHVVLLEDPSLIGPAYDGVREGLSAARAWHEATQRVAREFETLSDSYQRDRAQDVRSAMHRVERALLGLPEADPQALGILVVDELDPATAIVLDPDRVLGVATLRGGDTGHGVLIARARGVPVLPGLGERAAVPTGTVVALDERRGTFVVDPDADERASFERLLDERGQIRREAQVHAGAPAVTTDGHRVVVKANVSDSEEARHAREQGAEGSGLVRTEVLFDGWDRAPTVTEQVHALNDVARAMGGAPLTIRTWDIGADKPLAFMTQQPEANPFLGVRGLRSFREHAALLVDQLDAVCRVARDRPVQVMFPMIGTVEEVDWALDRLDEAAARSGPGRPEGLGVGIMIEVPAAALRAEALTSRLDFVSVGTNDLTQYTLAVERGNDSLAWLLDPVDPAVLRLIRTLCEEVAEGVVVGVCGAAAGDPLVAGLLVGLGVDELSATAVTVPEVKAALRGHNLVDLQDLADRALRCDSAAEVRALLAR